MKKENRVSREVLAAIIKRAEGRTLQKSDYPIVTAIIKKTFALQQIYREGREPSDEELEDLLTVPRPEKSDE